MKLIKMILKALLVIAIFSGILILILNKEKSNDKYKVVEWDNYYNENNLEIFYTENDKRLETLNSTYRISEFLSEKNGEIEKVFTVVDIVNSIVEYDDVEDSKHFNAYDILSNKIDGKKVSGKDMAIITRDFLTSVGYTSRVGEFRNEKGWFIKDKSYHVVEYWSAEYNKWIMIDFVDRGYFKHLESPCSAIEVATNKISAMKYIGKKSKNNYINDKKDVFSTYTIMIDSTLDMKKSNSMVTFAKHKKGIYLEHKNKYLAPTIFTEDTKVFDNDPSFAPTAEDSGSYIILMKKEGENNFFIIGGFKNGSILNQYFIRKDNGDFIEVKKYDEIDLSSGAHSIEISLNGESTLSKVKIEIKKN